MITITITDTDDSKPEQQVGKIEIQDPQHATVTGDVSAIATYRALIEKYSE
jgi:hypothetical protein